MCGVKNNYSNKTKLCLYHIIVVHAIELRPKLHPKDEDNKKLQCKILPVGTSEKRTNMAKQIDAQPLLRNASQRSVTNITTRM
jgi:hypothetical protein